MAATTDHDRSDTPGRRPAAPRRRMAQARLRGLCWLAALCVVCIAQAPLMGLPYPGVWSPAGGLALALVAWFGPRAALIPLAAGAVALLPPSTGPKGWTAFATCVESSANV